MLEMPSRACRREKLTLVIFHVDAPTGQDQTHAITHGVPMALTNRILTMVPTGQLNRKGAEIFNQFATALGRQRRYHADSGDASFSLVVSGVMYPSVTWGPSPTAFPGLSSGFRVCLQGRSAFSGWSAASSSPREGPEVFPRGPPLGFEVEGPRGPK